MIDWPHCRLSSSPSVRAMMSTAPPGGNGTRTCTGAEGYAPCASAPAQPNAAPASAPRRRSHPLMPSSHIYPNAISRDRALSLGTDPAHEVGIIPPLQNQNGALSRERLHRLGQNVTRISGGTAFMADGTKRVFYVNGPAHEIFTEILEKRADIRLDKLKNDSDDDVATPILAGAHAYQTGSARDELAKKYHAGPDLLRRTQSLLIVSTNGAGYDTVNLKACTEAGVLCLNQAGGNKEAVAEHALALMLGLTKRIIETDRAMRRDKDLNRNLFVGHDLFGKTVGIVGLGNVGKDR